MLTFFLRRISCRVGSSPRPTPPAISSQSEEILLQRRKRRQELKQKVQSQIQVGSSFKHYQDSVVNMLFFMRHDEWQSQYTYMLMNYNKLGFRRVSDIAFLDRASYFLKLRNKKEEERWPSLKINVALDPTIILTGMEQIAKFMRINQYFTHQIDKESSESVSLQSYIDEKVLPAIEALFWHPLLTFQSTFHTNLSSYEDTSGGNILVSIFARNAWRVLSKSVNNLICIVKQNSAYSKSKETLTECLRELSQMYLREDRLFFGGKNPSHIDFYLMAHLKTKQTSQLFMSYLQSQIGKSFWAWWLRMGSLCQYSKERVTLI